jgi:hypothetical protein
MSYVTVDLDSTLCDTRHRNRLVDQVNRLNTDWVAYAQACIDDEPIVSTVALLKLLAACDVKIVYVTGRDESARGLTTQWLDKYDLPNDGLFMDDFSNGATYNHSDYKLERVRDVLDDRKWSEQKHWFHIDDWPDVKVKLEDAGIPCICVRAPHEIDAFMQELKEGPM